MNIDFAPEFLTCLDPEHPSHLFILYPPHHLLIPRWLSGKEDARDTNVGDSRDAGFNPWVRKILWRRKWKPNPVFLPGKSHGQGSLAVYSPWGHKESDMTEQLTTHTHTYTHTTTLSSNFSYCPL